MSDLDKPMERIEILASLAREFLHRYGYLMASAGEDVIDEILAIDKLICEVAGRTGEES